MSQFCTRSGRLIRRPSLHHQIKLTMICPPTKKPGPRWDDLPTRPLGSQLLGLVESALQILAQKFQRHQAIEQGIARFVNRSHSSDADRFQQREVIEHALHSNFLPTIWAGDPRQRLDTASVDLCATRRAGLHVRCGLFSRHCIDCNIDD